jgi:hypothetical protein
VYFGNYYQSKSFDIKINDIIKNMEITELKRDSFLKMGKKASHSKFVRTMGCDDQKRDNPILNRMSGHLMLSTNKPTIFNFFQYKSFTENVGI